MSSSPTISVVIPLYNKELYIARTIDSILHQTIQDFEIVVIDDGSTDTSPTVVQRFQDERIRMIRQENQGESAARNRGVTEAKSEFIAFIDADDEWESDHLEVLLDLKEKFPAAGIFSTACKIILPNGEKKSVHYHQIPPFPWEGYMPDYFLSAAFGEPPVNSSSIGIRRDIFYQSGGFLVGRSFGPDLYLWMKIALKHPIAFSWRGCAVYHTDARHRVSEGPPHLQREPMVEEALKLIEDQKVPSQFLPNLRIYIDRKELNRAYNTIRAGKLKEGREILNNNFSSSYKLKKFKLLILSYIPVTLFRKIRMIYHALFQNSMLKN